EGGRACRSAGGGSSGVAHRPDAASLAALRRRSEARRVPRRERLRPMERSASRAADRRSRIGPSSAAPARVPGRAPFGDPSHRTRTRQGLQGADRSIPEGSRPDETGGRADRDRVSGDRSVDVPGGGAHGRNAVTRTRHPVQEDGRPLMSRTLLLSIAAALSVSFTTFAQSGPSVPPGGPGTVTLSRTDYDQLLELASRRPAAPDVPPVGAVLNRADIRVRVDATSARATMRVDGAVLRPGVSKVVLVKGATLLDARMDNRPLPVVAEGGAHVALVTGPGPFSATLEVGSPLSFNPGRGSFVLPVPGAGSATATIDVPGEQTDVHLS